MFKKLKSILVEESLLKYVISGVLILLLTCLLEASIFNYRHWQSLNNEEQALDFTVSDGFCQVGERSYEFYAEGDDDPYIEVVGLDNQVHNIGASFVFQREGPFAVKRLDYRFEIIDEGNSFPYKTPLRSTIFLIPQSYYNYLDTYGNIHSFKICFENLKIDDVIRVEMLTLNAKVPMMFSKKRVLALTTFLFLLFLLRPYSFLYNIRINDSDAIKKRIRIASIVAMLLMEIGFTYWATNLNSAFQDPQTTGEKQFMYMAEALAQGETHLLLDVPEGLKNCEDPYDLELRMHDCEGQEAPLWDTGYYGGHYFVYFGVAPIVCYYLPYYLITGTHIRTVTVLLINLILAIIGIAMLMYELAKRLYPRLPLSIYLMFTAMFTFGCGIIFLILKADFYSVPLAMALALCSWGLYCWIHSIKEDGSINPCLIAIGSLLLAIEAATRPQFLLVSFMALFIFWKAVFTDRKLFSKESIVSTISFIVPYVIIAALVMFYNYDRFGNPFDFGANYNLTANNMPYRGFRLDRLWHGTIGFMFYPCTVKNTFPYFDLSNYVSTYQGVSGDEILFGGLVYNNIILLLGLIGFRFKGIIKDKRSYTYVVIAPILALIVSFVDANMAGVIIRYCNDFSLYLFISTFIIIGALIETSEDGGNATAIRLIYDAMFICFIISSIRIFLDLFAGEANPRGNLMLTWETVMHLVEFWH